MQVPILLSVLASVAVELV